MNDRLILPQPATGLRFVRRPAFAHGRVTYLDGGFTITVWPAPNAAVAAARFRGRGKMLEVEQLMEDKL